MQPLHGNVFIPVNLSLPNTKSKALNTKPAPAAQGGFGEILSQQASARVASARVEAAHDKLQFSKHAENRLKSRDISLSDGQMQRAAEGVEKAKSKGIKDSLVLVDGVALVVNTKSNVVITALESSNDSIFTNIDGAVIV